MKVLHLKGCLWARVCLYRPVWQLLCMSRHFAYLYLYGDGLLSEQLREWQWQVNELQLQTSLHWHSSITYNLTALLSFPLHSATLQLLPHTQFCSIAGTVDKCASSYCFTCLVQLFCDILFNCSNQALRSTTKTINLSWKFLEHHSLATEDASCSALSDFLLKGQAFLPHTLPFLCVCVTTWNSLCGCAWLCVCIFPNYRTLFSVFTYLHECTKFSNQSICFSNEECVSCWHRLLLPIITLFISLSSSMVSAVAPVLPFLSTSVSFPPLHYHYCVCQSWFQIGMFGLCSFRGRKGTAILFYSKNICLISCDMLALLSQMEGYTLEMPGGISLVRLFRRNLQMLKSVSGMWELKGSSWRNKQLKMRDRRWRGHNTREIIDTNVQVLHFLKLHLS